MPGTLPGCLNWGICRSKCRRWPGRRWRSARPVARSRRLLQTQPSVAPAEAETLLQQLRAQLVQALRDEVLIDPGELGAYAQALQLLARAERRLAQAAAELTTRRIVIHSDLLFQAYDALFPPERLLVIAGRRSGDAICLGAPWDVTGPASAGHVKADPSRLGQALISIELSGALLSLWLHSHPGRTALATLPSEIDLRQHQEWLRHYSQFLLGATMVADGWIRFWGPALDRHALRVEVRGRGVVQEGHDGQLFQLQRA